MRKALVTVLVALATLAVALLPPGAGDGWALRSDGDEMWVYTRARAGSAIKEVKLIMNVDAGIHDLNAVLNEAERQPEWVFRCNEGRDLGGDINAGGWYYYSRIDMPWPLEDRDVVGRVKAHADGRTYTSHTVAAPERTPAVEGCVRLTDFDVNTTYRPLGEGRTEVTYELHSEPGGAVPAWLVNLFVERGPVETMTRLRDLVEG